MQREEEEGEEGGEGEGEEEANSIPPAYHGMKRLMCSTGSIYCTELRRAQNTLRKLCFVCTHASGYKMRNIQFGGEEAYRSLRGGETSQSWVSIYGDCFLQEGRLVFGSEKDGVYTE